ncbi:MAG: hypothetical protein MIO87_02285 [Methanomassiliicoccales archaeon]|nr:hypothetical protein [Methanomassiliicoccales archaeon]TFG56284.1 MAG: hypothetical protein E4H30_04680 [Methanomassiliicoccus sp.]
MKPEATQALGMAISKRRRDDSLEKALGREIRKVKLSYEDYVEIMEMVRAHARKHKLDAWESAQQISKEQEEQ